jgi:hypothetical protein
VLGDRVCRQQPQHALARIALPLLRRSLLALLLFRATRAILRARDRGGAGDQQGQQQAPCAQAVQRGQ